MNSPRQIYRRTFLRNARSALQLLALDADLIDKGCSFSYVVDASAIISYLNKESSVRLFPLDSGGDKSTYGHIQLALRHLFSKELGTLLLIPSYAEELNTHLLSISHDIAIAQINTLNREKVQRLLENSQSFRKFAKLRRENPSAPVENELRDAAVQIGREYFPELYGTLTFFALRGVASLRKLFRERILVDVKDHFPGLNSQDSLYVGAERWYKTLKASRSRDKTVANQIDALACAYLEAANAQGNRFKKLVLFMAPSPAVEKALEDTPLISLPSGGKIGVTRNLTYCLLAIGHKAESGFDLHKIQKSLTLINGLLEIYESPIPVELRVELKSIEARWTVFENLLLMSEPSIIADESRQPESKRDEMFLDVLGWLLKGINESTESLAHETFSRLRELRTEILELSRSIPAKRTLTLFKSISIEKWIDGVRMSFPGLEDELPFQIVFRQPAVIALAKSFRDLKRKQYSQESILQLRKYIVELLNDPENISEVSAEYHLLVGYILALERKYETALSELMSGFPKADFSTLRELKFVSAMLHRKLFHAKESSELLEEVIKSGASDPRFSLEYSKALWLKWREADAPNKEQILELAFEHLENASSAEPNLLSPELRAQIENVAAYLHTELVLKSGAEPVAGLAIVRRHIMNLSAVRKEEKWIGRFFDTRAYWRYADAIMSPHLSREEKKRMLLAALSDIKLAVEHQDMIGAQQGVHYEHKLLIEKSLADLASTEIGLA